MEISTEQQEVAIANLSRVECVASLNIDTQPGLSHTQFYQETRSILKLPIPAF